jgi:hypothetical protein
MKSRLLSLVISLAALGFLYSTAASAALVLHGLDGGTTAGDGKFVWNKPSTAGKCVDTVNKVIVDCNSTAPSIGYLYKGPISGKFYRTGTCWSRSLNIAVACSSASGFISSSFSHTGIGIVGGDLELKVGEISPDEQLMTVVPGAFGSPAKVYIDFPDLLVKGFVTSTNEPLGEGRFTYHVEYSIPIATSDPSGRSNLECETKCDPNNPQSSKKGTTSCTGCSVNQTCTNLSTTESQLTIKAFCQQGVIVTGYLTLLPLVNGSPQPAPPFTGCDAESVAAGECSLIVGGLPLTKRGTVDDFACAELFAAVDLLSDPNKHFDPKQLLLFQQGYLGQCSTATSGDFGLELPQGAKLGLHRECNSDAFDNVPRGCVVAENTDGSPAYHVVDGAETAKSIQVEVDVTPESVNLRCDAGTDSGIATATICTTPQFNVTNVDTAVLPVLFVDGDCDGGPCIVPAIPGGYSFAATSSGLCSGDLNQDMQITYRTCSATGTGLAQRIFSANPGIVDGTLVPVKLQGTSGNGTVPVLIEGVDTVKVVKTQ